ncbi:MAG TPA: S41 family peptidase [Chitinophagaceae bacterium]
MKIFKSSFRQRLQFAAMLLIIIGMSSCKRDIVKPELLSNAEANSFSDVFETFWQGINTQYLFWDAETVNWDSMYHVYKPRFDSLDKVNTSDTAINRCFQYMADMTKDLKDGQYALMFWQGGNFNFEDSLYKSYISFIPKYFRAQKIHAALPDTLFDYIVQYNYLKDFDYGVYRNYNTNQIFQIISGKISKGSKNVLYTSLNNFMLKESYDAPYPTRPTRPVIKNLFDKIHKSACDGVIIDLRNNRGGNLEDIDFLVGQFTSTPVVFGYARYKSGSGRLDYTPGLPMNITPQKDANDFKKPIVILTDIYTAALAESVIIAFKSLPEAQVTVIGERTYGTSGLITGNDISTNGGGFDMSNFASVRISNAAVQDKDHRFNFSGITPDIEVKYDASRIKQMLQSGIDIQLEKAIQFINK